MPRFGDNAWEGHQIVHDCCEPPAVDPSVAPPKIFAKYALSRKSADTPWIRPECAAVAKPWGRFDCVINVNPAQKPDDLFR